IYSGTPVATIGKPAIVSIVQINQLKALIGVSASYFPFVNKGMVAEITSDIYTDLILKGLITKIYPTIDQTTKTFTVELTIQNSSLKLRPGMFSKIQLNLGKGKAIMVPTIALIKQTGTNDMYVFVNNNGIAKKVRVTPGAMIDDKTEIVEGINENDEIIVVGQNKLDDKKPLIIEK
ncbi:MAG TPA: efflux RND transporter periplasmic adaptor subunit, partial [Bacteroidales bacterium]|nr:efflux RND transporter periplasmic adaptor subunit [Bacteroidales bacterium]